MHEKLKIGGAFDSCITFALLLFPIVRNFDVRYCWISPVLHSKDKNSKPIRRWKSIESNDDIYIYISSPSSSSCSVIRPRETVQVFPESFYSIFSLDSPVEITSLGRVPSIGSEVCRVYLPAFSLFLYLFSVPRGNWLPLSRDITCNVRCIHYASLSIH